MDQIQYPPRRELSSSTAALLAGAHRRTGLTYDQAGEMCGIDGSYFRRLTVGERCPSRSVALRIIFALDLDPATAEQLLAESVDKGRSR